MLTISKQTAQAFLYQKIIEPRFLDARSLLYHLEAIQIDPVAVIERNHHLTASLRMAHYDDASLEALLEDGHAFEYFAQAACLLPIDDYPLFADVRKRMRQHLETEMNELTDVIKLILSRLANEGALTSSDFTSKEKVIGGWDTGVAKTKQTSHALQLLFYTGKIQVAARKGAKRYFKRTEDVIPPHLLAQEQNETTSERAVALQQKYARAYRLFSYDDPRYGWLKHSAKARRDLHEAAVKNSTFTAVQIEGVKRHYSILTVDTQSLLSAKEYKPKGIYFLSPLDPFLWRRERVMDLFDFNYRWEMYVPQAKRRVGPYGMPILWDGELVGQISPYLDRKQKKLWIHHIVFNPSFQQNDSTKRRLDDALTALAMRVGATSFDYK